MTFEHLITPYLKGLCVIGGCVAWLFLYHAISIKVFKYEPKEPLEILIMPFLVPFMIIVVLLLPFIIGAEF